MSKHEKAMNKYEKSILFIPQVLKALYVIILGVNLFMPISSDGKWGFSLFQIAACIIHFIGLLAGIGYLIVSTHEFRDGAELFEQRTSLPIMLIGILRVFQFAYYFMLKQAKINWVRFSVLIVIDVIYVMILLLDKARYGYAKKDAEDYK